MCPGSRGKVQSNFEEAFIEIHMNAQRTEEQASLIRRVLIGPIVHFYSLVSSHQSKPVVWKDTGW